MKRATYKYLHKRKNLETFQRKEKCDSSDFFRARNAHHDLYDLTTCLASQRIAAEAREHAWQRCDMGGRQICDSESNFAATWGSDFPGFLVYLAVSKYTWHFASILHTPPSILALSSCKTHSPPSSILETRLPSIPNFGCILHCRVPLRPGGLAPRAGMH